MSQNPHIGVITFPGSNGDHDALWALDKILGVETSAVDYRESSLSGLHALVLPGGFSFGDYLRCGAIARFAPVMSAVSTFAASGAPVLGICNGFQILTEALLLPGALLRNRTLRFHCHWSHIRLEPSAIAWGNIPPESTTRRLPVAHGDGAYYIDAAGLHDLEQHGQIVARYCSAEGHVTDAANVNGSVGSIAAVSNRRGNVVGLMPHPERAVEARLGGEDGVALLRAFLLDPLAKHKGTSKVRGLVSR